MQQLAPDQFFLAQPLFAKLAEFNLSIAAVLAGTAPGEVYVDDATPRIGPSPACDQLGWRARPERLAHNWVFASLRRLPEFEAMIALLQQEVDNNR